MFFSKTGFAAKVINWNYLASPSGEVKSPTDYQHANHSPSSRSVHFINHHLKSSPRDSTPCTPKDSPPKPKMSLVQWYRTTHRPKFLNRDKNDVIDNDMKIGRKGKFRLHEPKHFWSIFFCFHAFPFFTPLGLIYPHVFCFFSPFSSLHESRKLPLQNFLYIVVKCKYLVIF